VDTVGRQFIDQGARIFAGEIEQRVAPVVPAEAAVEEHVEAPIAYGWLVQAAVVVVTIGSIVALVILRIVQTASR
jgi:hypothetical protein